MGVVYRAHDTALDRIVALKVLKEDLRSNKQVAARFQREAQAIASLSHPGIIHIFAVGSVGRIPFISMEFIEGLTLSQLMKREKRVPWKRALHIAEQVAEALACAHDAHIIHRDIKPGNVLLGADDRAYVTDFGIAKVLTAETQLTVEGSRLGTPNYMSPERCMNQEITPSSDVYSLGVVLFQMISGRLPYEAESPVDLIRKIVSDPPARLTDYIADVPADVERLVAYLIEKKPKDRPNNAEDVARMCRRVIEGEPLFEESALASSLREFRDSDPSTSTGTTGLGDTKLGRDPLARIRRAWRKATPAAKLWTVGVGIIVAAGALGQLALLSASDGLARQTVNQWDRSTTAWTRPSTPAEFTPESQGVTLVRFNLPRMTGTRILSAGAREFVVELKSASGADLRAVVMTGVDPRSSRILLPPGSQRGGAGDGLVLAAESGVSPAFPRSVGVLFGRRTRGPDGGWRSELVHVDASLSDESYGRSLVDANSLGNATAEGRGSVYLAAISPWAAEIAFAADHGSAEGHRVFVVPMAADGPSGVPNAVGVAGGQIAGITFNRDGSLVVARQIESGHLGVFRYSASGGSTLLHRAEDANTTLADLSGDRAAFLSGPDNQRVVTIVDLSSGAVEPVGQGRHAALGADGYTGFVTASDYRGNMQVYRVDVRAPSERTQLTFLAQGVGDALAVSGDGEFVAVSTAERGSASLVLIDVGEAAKFDLVP